MAINLIGVNGKVPSGGRISATNLASTIQATNPSMQQRALSAGTAKINYADKNQVSQALGSITKYHTADQVKLLQHASLYGLVDKKKASDAILQILNPGPVQPKLNGFEKVVKGGVDIAKATAKSAINVGRDIGQQSPERGLYGIPNRKLVGTGASMAVSANHKQELGDLLATVSLAGAPEAKAVLAGGKAGLGEGLKLIGLGAAGGEGATLAANPNASIKQQLENMALGGAAGASLPVAGALVGKSAAKVAAAGPVQKATEAASGAVRPVVGKIDTSVKNALQNLSTSAKKSVEALPGGSKVTGALNAARDKVATQLIDSNHPLLKVARGLDSQDAGGRERNVRTLFGDIAGSERRADHAINNSAHVQQYRQVVASLGGDTNKARQAVGDYINAKRQMQLIDQGRKAGKAASPERYAAYKATAQKLADKYGAQKLESARQALINFEKEGTSVATGIGHTKQQVEDWLATDPEYIRTQYKQSQEKLNNNFAKTSVGGNTNISGQRLNKFATGEAHDPFATAIARHHSIEKYVATQRFKKGAVELLHSAGIDTNALKTTAKTLSRKEAQQFLHDSRPASQVVKRLLTKNSRELRVVQAELNSLSRKGLNASLSKPSEDTLAGKLVDPGVKLPPREVKNIVASLIAKNSSELTKLRAMIARRDPKAAALVDEIGKLKDEAEAFSNARSGAYKEILKNKDLSAHGMPTITFDEHGIRNAYQVPEAFANAANQTNVKHAPEILRKANNVFKYGTTQGNPAFALPNFLKDQVSSYFNSESAASTHNPVNIATSLFHTMTGGKFDASGLYDTFSKGFGEARRVDINRSLKQGVRDINRGVNGEKNLSGKVHNVTLRDAAGAPFKLNNSLIGKLEETTRFQNYRGTYNLYKRKGYSDAEAKTAATRASRENSTDFNAAGETGRFLNGISPYLNAGIQGSRTIGRSLRERPATTSAKLASVAAPVLALTQWNLGDPQRAATYSQLPDYTKNTNFVITVGNHNFLLPMSQEAQGIAGVYRTLMEAHFGKNPTSFVQEAKLFAKNISPVQADNPLDAVTSFFPGAAKVATELGANKDFYSGSQIVPDYLKAKNPNPLEQKYANTSGTSSAIASALSHFGVHASPLQIDYALKNSLGEVGGPNAENLVDKVTGGTQGGRSPLTSISRRFEYQGGNDVKTQFNNVYYPLKDATTTRRNTIYGLIKDNKLAQATRKADEYNAVVDTAKQAYVKQYGHYADPADLAKFDNLKIAIQTSKAGKKYVKF